MFLDNATLTFNGFWSKFLRKRQIWISEPHFEEIRGDERPWLMAAWTFYLR